MSRSKTAENATSVTRMSTVRRTKVCDVVSARSSTNAKKRLPTRLERLGTTASNTQTTANKPRITSVWMPVRADNSTDMASTGPSSPRAIRENRVAHARAGERALTHDGHKRTERRRSEGKRHGDTVEMTD